MTLSFHDANDFFYVICICHILNVIVQNVSNDIREIMGKIKFVGIFIFNSSSRIKIFRETSKINKVRIENFTMMSSISGIKVILEYNAFIDKFVIQIIIYFLLFLLLLFLFLMKCVILFKFERYAM